jgi:hypothetical protein
MGIIENGADQKLLILLHPYQNISHFDYIAQIKKYN